MKEAPFRVWLKVERGLSEGRHRGQSNQQLPEN